MAQLVSKESISVEGSELIERLKQLVHEGNVRRIIIKHGERSLLDLPLTVGVVGAMLAPELAAAGALAALVSDCTIEVERLSSAIQRGDDPQAAAELP